MIRFISLLVIVILLVDFGELENRSADLKESTQADEVISSRDQLNRIESDFYCSSFFLEGESDSDETTSLNTIQTISINNNLESNSFFHQFETHLVSLILFEADNSPPVSC